MRSGRRRGMAAATGGLLTAGALAAGATAASFVSEKTVEYHLSNIYEKLGLRSRVELAGRLKRPAASTT